ncbi:MAG: XRE family transcriptional regulator [Candidatus Omnitrophica bacterium]|nr:XRE family transcriptional regulator [Candidatus Omnitrophota bacterium]
MKRKEIKTLYSLLGEAVRDRFEKEVEKEKIEIHKTIRNLRHQQGLTVAQVCQRVSDLNPKTLAAIETGRIKNPSIKTLQSLARALGVTVSEIFSQTEVALDRHFHIGTQKGAFQMEFPPLGLKAISFTPLIPDFFCGKIILGSKRRVDQTFWNRSLLIYVSSIMGRLEIEVEGRKIMLTEGENLYFNGILKHSFYNPMHRDSVFLMVTAPSFV